MLRQDELAREGRKKQILTDRHQQEEDTIAHGVPVLGGGALAPAPFAGEECTNI